MLRILWGCESNLIFIIVAAVLGGICLLGIFNQSGKPLTIELPIPAPAGRPTPTPPARKLWLTEATTGTVLMIVNNEQREDVMLFSFSSGQSVTPTVVSRPQVITNTGSVLSNDRTRAAFVQNQNGMNQLFLSGPTGIAQVPFSDTLKIPSDTPLRLSPSGLRLAFIAESEADIGQKVRFLYIVMTTGSMMPTPVMIVTGEIYSPAWIDDDRIAYVIAPIGADEQVIAQSTSSITNSQVIWPVPR